MEKNINSDFFVFVIAIINKKIYIVYMSKKSKIHRGRFQAQGNGLEESESWAQDKPLSTSNALSLLRGLMAKLNPKDLIRRKTAFEKAEEFVENAGENGGIFAVKKKTFKVKGSKDERVDIEVLGGKAFVKKDENE